MDNHNHYFDEHGVYTASAPATPGTLPPDRALRIPPPSRDGFWPVLNDAGDGWALVENHRGEEGWLNGKLVEITDPGPLPDGWSALPPGTEDAREKEDILVYLTRSDTYHREGCGYTKVAGEWLRLSAVREKRPQAKACRRCRPGG